MNNEKKLKQILKILLVLVIAYLTLVTGFVTYTFIQATIVGVFAGKVLITFSILIIVWVGMYLISACKLIEEYKRLK